jgi:hypothetical protein
MAYDGFNRPAFSSIYDGFQRPPDFIKRDFPGAGAVPTYLDSMPGSVDAMNAAAPDAGGTGATSMEWVTVNYTPYMWDGQYPFHTELFQGVPIFMFKQDPKIVGTTPILLSLKHVNDSLRQGYEDAVQMWKDRDFIVQEKILTGEQYDQLMSTPTRLWNRLPYVQALVSDPKRVEYQSFRYLYKDGIAGMFAFVGYNTSSYDDMPLQSIAVAVHGSVQDVVNFWTPTPMTRNIIGFVLKRVQDPRTGRYGAFAYDPRPFKSGKAPTIDATAYYDVTGHRDFGPAEQIGTIDEKTVRVDFDQGVIDEYSGITHSASEFHKIGSQPTSLRIRLHPRPGLKVPWFH